MFGNKPTTLNQKGTTVNATIAAPRSQNVAIQAAHRANDAARTALAWAKALAAKALHAVKGGWTTAFNTVSNFVKTHGTALGLGASLLMATRKGYHSLVEATHSALSYGRKAINWTMDLVSKGIGEVGSRIAQLLGKVSKPAGDWVQGTTWSITGFIAAATDWFNTTTTNVVNRVKAAATSRTVTRITNWFSMAVFAGIASNVITGGAIAASLTSIPVIGSIASAAILGGPLTIALLLGIAVLGTGYALVFNAKAVDAEIDEATAAKINADTESVLAEKAQYDAIRKGRLAPAMA